MDLRRFVKIFLKSIQIITLYQLGFLDLLWRLFLVSTNML